MSDQRASKAGAAHLVLITHPDAADEQVPCEAFILISFDQDSEGINSCGVSPGRAVECGLKLVQWGVARMQPPPPRGWESIPEILQPLNGDGPELP